MPTSTVDRRGRITVPGEFRALLGLQPGSAVHVDVEGKALRIAPAGTPQRDPFLERVQKQPLRLGRKVAAEETRRLREETWGT
ncbi:MAG: AbrB/MazE/SpoVT family DNA-binding domain-containing protein [Halobacteria archaeon]